MNEVRDLGATAQADLGLDYAWLDDVTVKDWAVSGAFSYHETIFAHHTISIFSVTMVF